MDKLTEYHQKNGIKYHVAVKANGQGCWDETKAEGVVRLSDREFIYHNARVFKVHIPEKLGKAQAIYYDCAALNESIRYIRENGIQKFIVYIMACRIGPFAKYFYERIHALGGELYLNPDGHEWKRAKWSAPIRKYWKWSEYLMVKYSDLVICDSVNIEKYIHQCYDEKGLKGSSPKTIFIAYGAETRKSELSDEDETLLRWYEQKQLVPKQYYLVVGRFVPENNYEIMIREFMRSKTKKDFALITNVNESFLNELERKLHFTQDSRIKFVGTVYDKELLMKIRENSYGYFHGHEVGGTNPSLLEALSSTDVNLVLDVNFNREVAQDGAIYWTKEQGSLAKTIEAVEQLTEQQKQELGRQAKERIKSAYSWKFISSQYAKLFVRREW